MRRLSYIFGLAVILSAVALADDLAEYQPLMKKAAATCGALKKQIDANDGAGASTSADQLASDFAAIEAFWKEKGDAEAANWAADVAAKAHDIHSSAGANVAGVAEKFKAMTANCGACHGAKREKAADGSWKFK